DPDGDPLTYHLDTAPGGMAIDATGFVTWQPTAAQFGANAVVVRVDDGRGGNAGQSFTVNVVSQQVADRPPAFVSKPPVAATVGLSYRYDAQAVDPEGDPLAWSLDAAPAGMSIDPQQGAIRWTPTADQVGAQHVAIRVRDGQGSISVQGFTITV